MSEKKPMSEVVRMRDFYAISLRNYADDIRAAGGDDERHAPGLEPSAVPAAAVMQMRRMKMRLQSLTNRVD